MVPKVVAVFALFTVVKSVDPDMAPGNDKCPIGEDGSEMCAELHSDSTSLIQSTMAVKPKKMPVKPHEGGPHDENAVQWGLAEPEDYEWLGDEEEDEEVEVDSLQALSKMMVALESISSQAQVVSRTSSQPSGAKTKVMQFNVFEDGLTEAPGNFGFPEAFQDSFTSLLKVLSDNGKGDKLKGFGKVRWGPAVDLPPVRVIDSTSALFGFIDTVYSAFYHVLGGDARFGKVAGHKYYYGPSGKQKWIDDCTGPGMSSRNKKRCKVCLAGEWESHLKDFLQDKEFEKETIADLKKKCKPIVNTGDSPELGNSLRTLYLHTDPPHGEDKEWTLPRFESELHKIAPSEDITGKINALRKKVFDQTNGQLVWERSTLDGTLWKRGTNIWKSIWLKVPERLKGAEAREDLPAATKQALSLFGKVYKEDPGEKPLDALIGVVLDADGDVQEIRTLTMQNAARFLIHELCRHSMENEEAEAAIQKFTKASDVPKTAEGRTKLIVPSVLNAMNEWMRESSLVERSKKVWDTVKFVDPDIVTLVEYNKPWQGIPLPDGFNSVMGEGSAAVLFKPEKYEHIQKEDLLKYIVPVDGEAPKSSCVALLRRKLDSVHFLVASIHLPSGLPDGKKIVVARQQQLHVTLQQLSNMLKALRHSGTEVAVVLAGDFNAIAQEFALGTSQAFWDSSVVEKMVPKWTTPAKQSWVDAAVPPLATMPKSEDDKPATLHLLAPHMELQETTAIPTNMCTRAGATMVIDFIFASIKVARKSEDDADTDVAFTPLQATRSRLASAQASGPVNGIYNAVKLVGSDHLPVATTLDV